MSTNNAPTKNTFYGILPKIEHQPTKDLLKLVLDMIHKLDDRTSTLESK